MNSQEFNFNDFTIESYNNILSIAKSKAKFVFYNQINEYDRHILWRHDIDFSVQRAYRLAEIEKNHGLKSTYFLHLHNEFYNIFEKEIYELICKIMELGHQIGLHFDTHFYNIKTESELSKWIKFEKNILEKVFNQKIETFSFHNTNPTVLRFNKMNYGGLLNTYSSMFQKDYSYCSDSNGYWRHERLHNFLLDNTANKIQVLTHPEWWQESIMSPFEKIKRSVYGRAEKNLKTYRNYLKANKMKNIDWEAIDE